MKKLKAFFISFNSVCAKERVLQRNNRKKYIHIDWKTGSNEIYAMLDEIESDTESGIENLLEDSDTEYISEEPIPHNKEESHHVLTPEATVMLKMNLWM